MKHYPSITSTEAQTLYEAYLLELQAEFKQFAVVYKRDSAFCRAVDRCLKIVTFGAQRDFMEGFITTFGSKVYVPESWRTTSALSRYTIMRHEAVHLRQFRRWTWLGMGLFYLSLPLPFGFALGRTLIEWAGYRETLVVTWQAQGPELAASRAFEDYLVGRFTGPDYGWMWIWGGSIRKLIRRTVAQLKANPPAPLHSLLPPPEALS